MSNERIFRVNLSLTPAEYECLRLLANNAKLPPSTYARTKLTKINRSEIIAIWEELKKANVPESLLVQVIQ